MTTLPDLLRAVLDNPTEDVPVRMLADYLLEQGDGRGEILRRWVEGSCRIGVDNRSFPEELDYSDISTQSCGLQSYMAVGTGHIGYWPVFEICIFPTDSYKRDCLYFRIFTSIEDARLIADQYPNPAEIHSFLIRHYADPKLTVTLRKQHV